MTADRFDHITPTTEQRCQIHGWPLRGLAERFDVAVHQFEETGTTIDLCEACLRRVRQDLVGYPPAFIQRCSVCEHIWHQATDPANYGDEPCQACGAPAEPFPMGHSPANPTHDDDCVICKGRAAATKTQGRNW